MSKPPLIPGESAPSGGEGKKAAARPPKVVAEGNAVAHDRAVSALQGLAKPQPKANVVPEGGPIDLNEAVMSGASGFVGILARRQPGPGDSHMPVNDEEARARRAKYPLHMAREIGAGEAKVVEERLPIPAPAVPVESPRVAMARVQRGKKSQWAWGMLAVAVVLFVIGVWAAGAIFYMQAKAPNASGDVGYLFIVGQAGEPGTYALWSVRVAWGLVLCLPVSLVMGGMWAWRRRW